VDDGCMCIICVCANMCMCFNGVCDNMCMCFNGLCGGICDTYVEVYVTHMWKYMCPLTPQPPNRHHPLTT